jgi:hypothetical protein
MRDLEISNPQLLKQVHIFSTFFYNKLNIKTEYAMFFNVPEVLSFLTTSVQVWMLHMKASANGRKSWTFSQKNLLLCPLMSSTFSLWPKGIPTHGDSWHWYLVIIYQPEHILKDCPGANHKSSTGRQARQTATQVISEDVNSSRIGESSDIQNLESLELLHHWRSCKDTTISTRPSQTSHECWFQWDKFFW